MYDEKSIVFTHPSYGMVQFARIQGSRRLFGSSLQSFQSFISLRISPGRRIHSGGEDHYHADAMSIIEIDLSAAQFAELITSLNIGSGVPCTIRRMDGKSIEEPPDEPSEVELVQTDMRHGMTKIVNRIQSVRNEVESILAKPTIGKAARRRIVEMLNDIVGELSCNVPFVLELFQECTTRIVSHAKIEVDAFITHALLRSGVKAIQGDLAGLLPDKKAP